jgi:chemotaxis protein methyltransferase CheR
VSPHAFAVFAALLRNRSGLTIGPDKLYLLETRLTPLLRQHRIANLDGLATRLAQGRCEKLARAVVEAMATNETYFFRDITPFAHFRDHTLRYLHASRPASASLRLWSAAASTGQEAYSLAMIVAESSPWLGARGIEIVATDIARTPLERARAGHYTQFEIQRGVPMAALVRHFQKQEAGWRIAENLRAMVRFQEWNLLTDLSPLGRFDVIFCRNVLIYFDRPTKMRVLEALAEQLAPDGVLYLGGAETTLGLTSRLVPEPGAPSVYRRVSDATGTIALEMNASSSAAASAIERRPVSRPRSGAFGTS